MMVLCNKIKYGYYDIGKSIPHINTFTDGSHILVVRNPTDYIDTAIELENSGWEVRDCIKVLLKDKTLQCGLLRKPFKGTVANNVLTNGCGGINIDISRIGNIVQDTSKNGRASTSHKATVFESGLKKEFEGKITTGRFPANLLLNSASAELMDSQSGDTSGTRIGNPNDTIKKVGNNLFGGVEQKIASISHSYRDKGGASRFFFNFNSQEELKKYLTNLIRV